MVVNGPVGMVITGLVNVGVGRLVVGVVSGTGGDVTSVVGGGASVVTVG